jgi:hypothetical protein
MLLNGFGRNRTLWSVKTGISSTPVWSWIQGYTTLANGNTVYAEAIKQRCIELFINSKHEVI